MTKCITLQRTSRVRWQNTINRPCSRPSYDERRPNGKRSNCDIKTKPKYGQFISYDCSKYMFWSLYLFCAMKHLAGCIIIREFPTTLVVLLVLQYMCHMLMVHDGMTTMTVTHLRDNYMDLTRWTKTQEIWTVHFRHVWSSGNVMGPDKLGIFCQTVLKENIIA